MKRIFINFTVALGALLGVDKGLAAQDTSSYRKPVIEDLVLPNTLGTHPFGVYISRISHNFQTRPHPKKAITLQFSSGNVWLPRNIAYVPKNEQDRVGLGQTVWHDRERLYDKTTPANTIEFHADGIYRVFQLKFEMPIFKNQEIRFNSRAYLLDRGNSPYSFITSDETIEWIHSNIAGGEDAFKRKHYGLNKADVYYKDINGKSFQHNSGHGMFTGIELDYFFYPPWEALRRHLIFTNIGVRIGANTNPINPGIDAGLSGSILKKVVFKKRFEWNIGLSLAGLRQKMISFGDGYQISSNPFLLSYDLMSGIGFQTKKGGHVLFAVDWWRQSAYNNKDEFEEMVLTSERISPHWFQTGSHLYRSITSNSFMFTYSKSFYAWSIYLREDFKVDNAPDAQTGCRIQKLN